MQVASRLASRSWQDQEWSRALSSDPDLAHGVLGQEWQGGALLVDTAGLELVERPLGQARLKCKGPMLLWGHFPKYEIAAYLFDCVDTRAPTCTHKCTHTTHIHTTHIRTHTYTYTMHTRTPLHAHKYVYT